MSDLLERLRDMAAGKSDDLDIAAEAIEEIIDLNWRVVLIEEERDALRAQIAAHEKVCAGTWVKVAERLPEPRRVVSTRTGENSWVPSNWIEGGVWRIANDRVVEWFDVRLPGGEEG